VHITSAAKTVVKDQSQFHVKQENRKKKRKNDSYMFVQVLFPAMEDMGCTLLTSSLAQIPKKEGEHDTSFIH